MFEHKNLLEIQNQLNFFGKNRIPCFFLFDFENKKPLCFELQTINDEEILFSFPNFSNHHIINPNNTNLIFNFEPLNFEVYKKSFDEVMFHLLRGNTYLLNLTFAIPITINCSLRELFDVVKAKYKLWIKNQFLVFSPETFVTIKNNTISTFPMKGTIDANENNAYEKLINNSKEISEHNTIVDLLRNDLSMVATEVRVKKFRYIEKINTNRNTLLQTSTHIEGKLHNNWHENLGNIFMKLLPAGSISGAPKTKTVEIIKSIESENRGYYTGVAGIYDGESVDSFVLIRYIEECGENKFFYRAGGGITTQSNAEEEYKELLNKVYVPVF